MILRQQLDPDCIRICTRCDYQIVLEFVSVAVVKNVDAGPDLPVEDFGVVRQVSLQTFLVARGKVSAAEGGLFQSWPRRRGVGSNKLQLYRFYGLGVGDEGFQ